jgi:predicted transcriptional regulator
MTILSKDQRCVQSAMLELDGVSRLALSRYEQDHQHHQDYQDRDQEEQDQKVLSFVETMHSNRLQSRDWISQLCAMRLPGWCRDGVQVTSIHSGPLSRDKHLFERIII